MAALPEGDGDVIVRSGSFTLLPGMVLWLDRRGVRVRVDSNPAQRFGEHLVHRGGRVRAVFTVAVNDRLDELVGRPDLRLVAYSGTRSKQERARVLQRNAERRTKLTAAQKAGTISKEAYFRQLARLPRPGAAAGVFLGTA
jgi:hypothetical protein